MSSYLPDIHRPLPQSLDAEKGLLGSMLLSPKATAAILETTPAEAFHHPGNQTAFRRLAVMFAEGIPIDLVTLTEMLEKHKELESVGGAAAITELFTFVPTATNWPYYAGIVMEKWKARYAIEVCGEIIAAAYENGREQEIPGMIQDGLVKIAGFSESGSKTKRLGDVVLERLSAYEETLTSAGKLMGLSTGIATLDRLTGGLKDGNMIVIGARRKDGKTALAMNIADHVADLGAAVGIFSIEMTAEELADRFISSRAKIDFSKQSDGGFSAKDVTNLTRTACRLHELDIYLRDESILTPLQFRAAAIKMVAQHKVKLIVLDYAQIMTPENDRDRRDVQVAKFSRMIKNTAKELGIPIIVLSQLNADGASAESRALENDANLFLQIESDPVFEDKAKKVPKMDDNGIQILDYFIRIKLTRSSANARIPVVFAKDHTRFYEKSFAVQTNLIDA